MWPVDSSKSAVVALAVVALAAVVVAAAVVVVASVAAKASAFSSALYYLYPSFEQLVQHSIWPVVAIPVPWHVAKRPDRPRRLENEWQKGQPLSEPV